jgi:hypothetical protein
MINILGAATKKFEQYVFFLLTYTPPITEVEIIVIIDLIFR